MTTYHRGKARSEYRKRYLGVNISRSSAGVVLQTAIPSPTGGLTLTKSFRGGVVIRARGEIGTDRANGWVGWYRGQADLSTLNALPASTFLAQSECFGVQPWTLGAQDHIIPMELVGVTLSIAEYLVFVMAIHFESGSPTVVCDGAWIYAEKESPA